MNEGSEIKKDDDGDVLRKIQQEMKKDKMDEEFARKIQQEMDINNDADEEYARKIQEELDMTLAKEYENKYIY